MFINKMARSHVERRFQVTFRLMGFRAHMNILVIVKVKTIAHQMVMT